MYRPNSTAETIAALATAPGEGGIAIIRISGREALAIGEGLTLRPLRSLASHTAGLRCVYDENGKPIDQALILIMKGPKSFTGDDTVEVHCHGGRIASKKILERIFSLGARPALAGEFTFRAFLNGKIDLAQAEAVCAMIQAKSDLAFQKESEQQLGILSKKIRGLQEEVAEIAAIFEAWVDFPEEGLDFCSTEEMLCKLQSACSKIAQLIASYEEGAKLKTAISLSIVGSPNVGKSSLLNALAGYERAIVTATAGTTRDLVEEEISFRGLSFRLIDSAGVRETCDLIEQEGIKRSLAAASNADLVLFVLDASRAISEGERELLDRIGKGRCLLVFNKIDLIKEPLVVGEGAVALSAKEKIGLEELKDAIERTIWQKGALNKEEIILTEERHRDGLQRSLSSLKRALALLESSGSAELVAYETRASLLELGYILGTDVTEEVLSQIFSKFCIGK